MIKFLGTYNGKVFLNIFISAGASVVILGALGKILHASWGTVAITAGMLTECLIFFILAFVPQEHHPHWENYYPDLYTDPKKLGDGKGKKAVASKAVAKPVEKESAPVPSTSRSEKAAPVVEKGPNPVLNQLDDMLRQADITPTNLKQLSDSFAKLNTTVGKVSDISASSAYVQDFANRTKEANEALVTLKDVYINAAQQFNSNNFASGVRDFYEQMQGITKNISSLNAIYGVEIRDTMEDIKKVRKYFNSIDVVATQLNESVEEVRMTKQQLGLLIKNLSHLNSVYGNMLGAMQAPYTA